jgi:D-alanyl-lipoteichoic acid acyltransferase DltB (MBOAT superfamily)
MVFLLEYRWHGANLQWVAYGLLAYLLFSKSVGF